MAHTKRTVRWACGSRHSVPKPLGVHRPNSSINGGCTALTGTRPRSLLVGDGAVLLRGSSYPAQAIFSGQDPNRPRSVAS